MRLFVFNAVYNVLKMVLKIVLASLFIGLVAAQTPAPQPPAQPVAQPTAAPQPPAQPVAQPTAAPQPPAQPAAQPTAAPQPPAQPQPPPMIQPVQKPPAPENVLFQFTSRDSFMLSWVSPPGQFDSYLLHYFPDSNDTKNMVAVEINKNDTHYGAVDPHLDITQLGVNFYTMLGQTKSAPAQITVLNENDPRLPPSVTSATMQWVDDSSVQLQWTPPQGDYDSFLLLYAPNKEGVTARSVVLDKSRTSYKMKELMNTFNYTIHLYTVRNGIHSAPPDFHVLPPSAHACAVKPCQHEGTCVENKADPSNFLCQCTLGYTGTLCEDDIKEAINNKCTPNPCKNGGQCMENKDGRACTCKMGFVGELCESAGVAVRASIVFIGLLSALCWMII